MSTYKLNFHFMKIWYNVDFYFSLLCILDSTIPMASTSFYIFVSSPDSVIPADKSSFPYSCHKVFMFAFTSEVLLFHFIQRAQQQGHNLQFFLPCAGRGKLRLHHPPISFQIIQEILLKKPTVLIAELSTFPVGAGGNFLCRTVLVCPA